MFRAEPTPIPDRGPASRRSALLALLLLLPVPSLGTWVWGSLAEGPVGNTVFALSKVWVFVLPVAWLVLVDRRRPTVPRPSSRGMLAACVTGLLIVACILAAHGLLGRHWIDQEAMRVQAAEVGLTTPWKYVLGAIYWCTVNSMLEEYVWRWFVFTRLEVLVPRMLAVLGSGFFFTLHHVIALDVYFDWRVTALGSLGVFIGGTTWSWLYLRYRNLWAAYVSHVFADVVIFAIGWQLLIA